MALKTKNKLYAVGISKNDTCFSYAIRRVLGYPFGSASCIPLSNHRDIFTPKKFTEKGVKVGDILLWDKNWRVEMIPTLITGLGEIITREVDMNRHCVVVEQINPIVVSECKLCTEEFNTPHLRIKNLNEFKRTPDKILRPKN